MLGTMPCLDLIATSPSQPVLNLEPQLASVYSLIKLESIALDTIVQVPGMRYQIKQ